MADKTLNEVLTSINDNEALFQNDSAKVVKFAYTKKAYDDNLVDGVPAYSFNQEQNIPLGSEEILDTNSTVLSKGFRTQGASLPRMLANHFFGRVSYNLNKAHDNVYELVKALLVNLGKYKGFATLDENNRIPYSQLPESAVELKGFWDASTNTTDNADIPSLINGTGTKGDFFFCSKKGWFDAETGTGSPVEITGYVPFFVNDRILYNNGTWSKLSGGAVSSVNNMTGEVTVNGDNIKVAVDGAEETLNVALEDISVGAVSVLDVEEIPETINKKVYRKIKTELEPVNGTSGNNWGQSSITEKSFNQAIKFNNLWVASSNRGMFWSEDGKTWNPSETTEAKAYLLCKANNILLASGGSTNSVGLWWSEDGKTWNLALANRKFYSPFYAEGIWLISAVASNDLESSGIWWSEDGKNWNQSAQTTGQFSKFAYGNGIWMAETVGTPELYLSKDAKNWTKILSDTVPRDVTCLTYAKGMWLTGSGISSLKGIFWSEDGYNWNNSTETKGKSFFDIKYLNGIFVASGYSGTGIWWSEDGKNWNQSSQTTGSFSSNSLHFGNGTWIACDSANGIYYSNDGKTWEKSLSITDGINYAYYSEGIWVACSNETGLWFSEARTEESVKIESVQAKDTVLALQSEIKEAVKDVSRIPAETENVVYREKIKINSPVYKTGGEKVYSVFSNEESTFDGFYSICEGNGVYVAGRNSRSADYSCIIWSEDGLNWHSDSESGIGGNAVVHKIIFGNGIFVACKDEHSSGSGVYTLWWSEDGKRWSKCEGIPSGIIFPNFRNNFIFGDGIFVIASYGGTGGIFWSIGGKTWNKVSSVTATFSHLAYGEGVWFAVGNGTTTATTGVWKSTDGKTWTKDDSVPTDKGIYYAGGVWLGNKSIKNNNTAVTVVRSDDKGANWATVANFTSVSSVTRFAYAEGVYLFQKSDCVFYYSKDKAQTFTKINGLLGEIEALKNVNGVWFAGSQEESYSYYSLDGINWNQIKGVSNKDMTDVIFTKDGKYLFTVQNGIYVSYAEISKTEEVKKAFVKDTELVLKKDIENLKKEIEMLKKALHAI